MSPTTAIHRLRLVLAANAPFSIAGGLLALVAGSWVSRELGVDHVTITRVTGASLVAFGIGVGVLAQRDDEQLTAGALVVSIADALWVVGTIAVVAAGVTTRTGTVVAVALGVAVADFGAVQYRLRAVGSGTASATGVAAAAPSSAARR